MTDLNTKGNDVPGGDPEDNSMESIIAFNKFAFENPSIGTQMDLFLDDPFQYSPLHFETSSWCNLTCPHCGLSCSPRRTKRFIPTEDIISVTESFSAFYRRRLPICISGGECTGALDHDKNYFANLFDWVLENPESKIAIKTNGYFAESDNFYTFMNNMDLFEYSPKQIMLDFSIDQFHQSASDIFIKILKDLICISKDIPIRLITVNATRKVDPKNIRIFKDIDSRIGLKNFTDLKIIHSVVHPFGRAKNLNGYKAPNTPVNPNNLMERYGLQVNNNGQISIKSDFQIISQAPYKNGNGQILPIPDILECLRKEAISKLKEKII